MYLKRKLPRLITNHLSQFYQPLSIQSVLKDATDYLNNPKPPYPVLSHRLKEEGEVRLRVWVDAAGAPSRVALSKSSGFERLDRIALETVQRWRFTPARQGDQAIAAQVIVPITFNLKD